MSASRIPVIGIVGGIGSGKSSLAGALDLHFRCCRLDADAAGHEALQQEPVKHALREQFGAGIFDAQGQVNRGALAAQVFGESVAQREARHRLEEIVHPVIRQTLETRLQQAQQSGQWDLVLLDAALLLEAGWDRMCHGIIFIDVPRPLRLQRVQQRGWSEADFDRREASQLSLDEKRRRADFVVDNSQSLESAATSVAEWLRTTFHIQSSPETSVSH